MVRTIAEGLIEQGLEQGKRELLLHQIRTKFGQVSEDLQEWVSGLHDAASLEQLAEWVLRAESLEQLQASPAQRPPRQKRRRRKP